MIKAAQTDSQRAKTSPLIPLLVAIVMAAASVFYSRGGVLTQEVEYRLPYYLSHAPLLHKIYDSNYLDGGMFQARELSYVFDYIDCKFIALFVALGHPHFLSLSHYVFLIAISLVLWRFGVDDLKLSQTIVLGLLVLFWTTPAVFLGGTFFRTAKIGVALAVVVMYWLIFRILKDAQKNPDYRLSARVWLTCFGWAWAATLFDRQGVYMVGLAVFFLAFWCVAYRKIGTPLGRGTSARGVRDEALSKREALEYSRATGRLGEASLPSESSVPLSLTVAPLKLMGAFVAALVLSVAYNHVIAPLLTLSMNGYWPDFHYQQLPWEKLTANPRFYASSGVLFYLDTVRFFLGNIPRWVAVIVLIGLVALVFVKGSAHTPRKQFLIVVLGLLLSQKLLIWLMNDLMVLRHEALLWEDVKRTYYPLPVLSMLSMSLLLALAQLNLSRSRTETPVSDPPAPPSGTRDRERGTELALSSSLFKTLPLFLLATAILANLIALPAHSAILRSDHAKEAYQSTPPVLDALRHLQSPNYTVPPEVVSNRVIQFFRDGTVPKTFQNPK